MQSSLRGGRRSLRSGAAAAGKMPLGLFGTYQTRCDSVSHHVNSLQTVETEHVTTTPNEKRTFLKFYFGSSLTRVSCLFIAKWF